MRKLLLSLVMSVFATTCLAGYDYRLEFNQASYNSIVGGGPVSVTVTLAEEVSGGDPHRFGDLSAVKFRLSMDNNASSVFSSFTYGGGLSQFIAPSVNTAGLTTTIDIFAEANPTLPLTVDSATRRSIVLGTFNFTPGVAGISNLSLGSSPDAYGNDNIDLVIDSPFDLLDFDALPGGSVFTPGAASFNVSAVPEPSTYALMGLTVAGVGMYRRFRKSKQVSEVVA